MYCKSDGTYPRTALRVPSAPWMWRLSKPRSSSFRCPPPSHCGMTSSAAQWCCAFPALPRPVISHNSTVSYLAALHTHYLSSRQLCQSQQVRCLSCMSIWCNMHTCSSQINMHPLPHVYMLSHISLSCRGRCRGAWAGRDPCIHIYRPCRQLSRWTGQRVADIAAATTSVYIAVGSMNCLKAQFSVLRHTSGEATSPAEQRPNAAAAAQEDDDDDDETCGFCIFMKGGGCKDVFKVCFSFDNALLCRGVLGSVLGSSVHDHDQLIAGL
jgi:hypothetical protein